MQAVIVSQIQGERDSNLVWQGIIIILQVPAATLNSLVHKSLMKRLSVHVCNLHLLIHTIHRAGIQTPNNHTKLVFRPDLAACFSLSLVTRSAWRRLRKPPQSKGGEILLKGEISFEVKCAGQIGRMPHEEDPSDLGEVCLTCRRSLPSVH